MKKLILAVLVLGSTQAMAFGGSATTQFDVITSVPDVCRNTISATPMDFGTYNPMSTTDATASNTIAVTCSSGAAYSIALDDGQNSSGGTLNLANQTAGMSDTLSYAIYQDSANTIVWGNGAPGSANPEYTAVGSGGQDSVTAYGVLPTGQMTAVSGSSYKDTITATLTY